MSPVGSRVRNRYPIELQRSCQCFAVSANILGPWAQSRVQPILARMLSITAHPSDTSNVSLTPGSHWPASAIVVDAVARGKPAATFNSAELPCGSVPGMITVA
jgi:hypothetical protein